MNSRHSKVIIPVTVKSLCMFVCLLFNFVVSGQTIVVKSTDKKAFQQKDIEFRILDSCNAAPVSFASAYLKKDTLITNYYISDDNGAVRFANVSKGRYTLVVEALGYRPCSMDFTMNNVIPIPPVLYLTQKSDMLDAAVVTAYSNLVEYRKDTLVYNASVYRFAGNATLEDLLKRMPGVNVDGGNIRVHGKEITMLTVNGRAFFFSDKTLALKNLPAKIVEKIKVIDNESGNKVTEKFKSQDNRHVMDVELKEEFKNGCFGNIMVEGGAIWDKDRFQGPTETDLDFGAKALACLYGSKDQLAILAQGDNCHTGNGYDTKFALNYNTSRIKKFESSFSALYGRSRIDENISSHREDLFQDYSISRLGMNATDSRGKRLRTDIQMKLTGVEKLRLEVHPYFSYKNTDSLSNESLSVADMAQFSNEIWQGGSDIKAGGISIDAGMSGIGPPGRDLSLRFKQDNSLWDEDGLLEMQSVHQGEVTGETDLHKDSRQRINSTEGALVYTEPLGSAISLTAASEAKYNSTNTKVSSYNSRTGTFNPHFSSDYSKSTFSISEVMYLTYRLKNGELSGGIELEQIHQSTDRKDLANSFSTGDSEWQHSVSPYIYLNFVKYGCIFFRTKSNPINGTYLQPSLNILGATDTRIGNIFLKPYFSYDFTLQFRHNKKKQRLNIIFNPVFDNNRIVYARWHSASGMQYMFPVNSRSSSVNLNLFASYNRSFAGTGRCLLSLYTSCNWLSSVSYEHSGAMEVIDPSMFNYEEFIRDIWGGSSGERFYSGKSDFSRERSDMLHITAGAELKYDLKTFSANLKVTPDYFHSGYKVLSNYMKDAWRISVTPSMNVNLPEEFFLESSLDCCTYKGYGNDCTTWDFSVGLGKDVGMFTLNLKCADIFNNTANMNHRATSEYVINTIRSHIGRRMVFSITFNFGKANAKAEKNFNSYLRTLNRL